MLQLVKIGKEKMMWIKKVEAAFWGSLCHMELADGTASLLTRLYIIADIKVTRIIFFLRSA